MRSQNLGAFVCQREQRQMRSQLQVSETQRTARHPVSAVEQPGEFSNAMPGVGNCARHRLLVNRPVKTRGDDTVVDRQ